MLCVIQVNKHHDWDWRRAGLWVGFWYYGAIITMQLQWPHQWRTAALVHGIFGLHLCAVGGSGDIHLSLCQWSGCTSACEDTLLAQFTLPGTLLQLFVSISIFWLSVQLGHMHNSLQLHSEHLFRCAAGCRMLSNDQIGQNIRLCVHDK